MKIYNYLNSVAKNFPNKFAFISKTQKITFLELKLKVENLAINLKRNGVRSNHKIAILSNNSIDYIIIELACAIIDAVAVPISASMAKKDIIKQIKFTDIKYVFYGILFMRILKKVYLK